MQHQHQSNDTQDAPSTAAAATPLPGNPIQPHRSPWHPDGDIADLEETLAEAIDHLGAVLKQIPTRRNRITIKARRFLAQFKTPKIFAPLEGSEDQ